MKAANRTDAKAQAGNTRAKKRQKQAIDNLFKVTGQKVDSATQAVMLGRTAHQKYTAVLGTRSVARLLQ